MGHVNLQSQGTQDAFYLKKHKESGGVGRARIFHGKTHESAEVGHPWHINLQSRRSPGAFCTRKHNDFSVVGGTRTDTSRKFTVEMKGLRHFTRENTTISPRLVGRAHTLHVSLQSK